MSETCIVDMSVHRVAACPPTVFYIPDFISETEERALLAQVYAAPRPKWTQLKNRRLQNWGGLPEARGMLAEPIPDWLQAQCIRIAATGVFTDATPNHILVNEYEPGQGIMPHHDGPMYHPTVTTISLGSHTYLDFYSPTDETTIDHNLDSRYAFSLLVEPRSLLVLQNDMYKVYMHGIKEQTEDLVTLKHMANATHLRGVYADGDLLKRGTRVSLTIRYVPQTRKANLNSLLLGLKKK